MTPAIWVGLLKFCQSLDEQIWRLLSGSVQARYNWPLYTAKLGGQLLISPCSSVALPQVCPPSLEVQTAI